MPSHKALLEIIGATASEVGVFILWQLLGIIPSWSAYVLFLGLIVVWLIIYFVSKPEQTGKNTQQTHLNQKQPEVFDTEILPIEGLHHGDSITFRVKLSGNFDHVMLQGEAKLPDGKWIGFTNRRTISGSHGSGWLSKGNLNGPHNGEVFEWKDTIPETLKPGETTFRIRGYQRPPYGHWVSFKLRGLLFLKEKGIIRSIDKKRLDYHEWKPIHTDRDHKVIIAS